MRIWGHRYNRDLQRYNLALRMIAHEARNPHHLRLDRPAWRAHSQAIPVVFYRTGPTKSTRSRGPSPQRLGFLGSARNRSEAAAFVGLCYLLDVLPSQSIKMRDANYPTCCVANGSVRRAEMYRAFVPESPLALEHAVLLITTVAQGHEFQVGHCAECGGVILAYRHTLTVGAVRAALRAEARRWRAGSPGCASDRCTSQRGVNRSCFDPVVSPSRTVE